MQRFISLILILFLAVLFFLYNNAYAGAALLGLGVLTAAGFLMNLLLRKSVSVKVKVDGLIRGKNADLRITFSNRSFVPIPFLTGVIRVENTYMGDVSKTRFTISLGGRSENVVAPAIDCANSGKYRVTIEKTGALDLLGIIKVPFKAGDHCNFTIIPDIFDMVVGYELRPSQSFDNDEYSPYKKGQDRSEVYQVRDYEEGDPVNQIHWKLSSKLDKVIVKDPALPIDKAIAIVFDKTNNEKVSNRVAEAMAEIAVSAGEALIEEGVSFSLIWNDENMQLIHTREIQFEESFIESIPDILDGKIVYGKGSFDELYGSLGSGVDMTHVIYICPSERAVPEELFGEARVIKLIASIPEYTEEYRELDL